MSKEDKIKLTIISLLVACIFLLTCVIGMSVSIADKNAYINGLLSDRAICEGKLDTVKQDYEKLTEELEKLKGELDG